MSTAALQVPPKREKERQLKQQRQSQGEDRERRGERGEDSARGSLKLSQRLQNVEQQLQFQSVISVATTQTFLQVYNEAKSRKE